MEVILKQEIVERLTSKGILAYVAVLLADGREVTTTILAGLVRCQTGVMLAGIKELAVEAPELIAKGRNPKTNKLNNKWRCGIIKAGDGVVIQGEIAERFKIFVDDLKKYWDNLNPTLPFSMGGKDGVQIRMFLTDHPQWIREDWCNALQNRKRSIVKYNNAPASAPLWTWVGKLDAYAAGPLDRFGLPVDGGGKHGEASDIKQRNREAVARAISNA